jgi:hypothetical protein
VYECERTELLGGINNVQSQVIECVDNCREQKYTDVPDKTIDLIKIKYLKFILWVIIKNKNIQAQISDGWDNSGEQKYTGGTVITIYWIYIEHFIVSLIK